ncbi:MAG: hypothetical protein GDA44_04410 [Prochloron sp. SP5CPC1]|nr:hypothetical protein [Candidatus Paraprochloron terpiosi SP5CPC1]
MSLRNPTAQEICVGFHKASTQPTVATFIYWWAIAIYGLSVSNEGHKYYL